MREVRDQFYGWELGSTDTFTRAARGQLAPTSGRADLSVHLFDKLKEFKRIELEREPILVGRDESWPLGRLW